VHNTHQPVPGWLFVLPWSLRHIGGVNQVVKSLIIQFREGGVFTPHLLTGSEESLPSGTAEQELIEPFRLDLWSPVDHKHPFRALISFAYRLPYRCWALHRIIRQHNIAIINPHFPDLESLVFVVLKKLRLFRGKVILSFHLSDVQHSLSTKGLERKLWRVLLRGTDHIVVVSDDLAKDVLTLDSAVAEKMTTIYNGVDLTLFRRDGGESRSRFPVPSEGRTILSIGAFLPRKAHDVLLRAFGRALCAVPDAHLVLVGGDGPEIEPLRQLINLLGLSEKVVICKDVPHERIPSFMFQAQVFALASRKEGHPLAIIEAGAACLPVVCTRTSGAHELISDRVTGRLVDFGDEHALSEALIDLLTHPEEAQRLATNFHEYVKNNLTWGHTYERYSRLGGKGRNRDISMSESAMK
jgi:glycosyltransferase involved in cell wall biosynthesis